MGPTSTISIHQALHGYSAGHRRLAGSIALPSNADRLVSVLSDASGAGFVKGFESYLTGYPIPEVERYVLARTWYAPEMPRPGSVWTHSLFLSFADLADIPALEVLTRCFRRPESADDLMHYERPLTLAIQEEPVLQSTFSAALASSLIASLYASPKEATFLISKQASTHEQLILALWSQQWPNLRSDFRFCTGSIEDRAEQGARFDLQVVPPSAAHRVLRQSPRATAITEDEVNHIETPAWVKAALTDLRQPSTSTLREFLRQFGVDAPHPRPAYRPLADLFSMIADSEPSPNRGKVAIVLSAAARLYPEATAGPRLKQGLFGSPDARPTNWLSASEAELLEALLLHRASEAFDASLLRIADRARSLFRRDREGALRLLERINLPPVNSISEAFASACVGQMTHADVAWQGQPPERYLWLLAQRPAWLLNPEPWVNLRGDSSALLVLLRKVAPSFSLTARAQLAVALADAGWDGNATEVIDLLGPKAVEALLNHLDQRHLPWGLGPRWNQGLSRHRATLRRWLANGEAGSSVLWFAAVVLDPLWAAREIGPEAWIPLTNADVPDQRPESFWSAAAFLYVLGLHGGSQGGPLLIYTFPLLHEALALGAVPFAAWQRLEQSLPEAGPWREWDKCSRLRRSLLAHFLEGKLAFDVFVRSIQQPSLFESMLLEASRSPDAKQFARRFKDAATSNLGILSREQKAFVSGRKWPHLTSER